MGFLSNLFGGNKEDKALREALKKYQQLAKRPLVFNMLSPANLS